MAFQPLVTRLRWRTCANQTTSLSWLLQFQLGLSPLIPLSKHATWDNEASVAFLQPHLQLLLLQGLQSREVNLRLEMEVHKLGDTLGISRVDQNAAHRSEWASNRLLAMEVSQAAVGGPSLHWSKPSNPAGLTYCWFPHWLTRATLASHC